MALPASDTFTRANNTVLGGDWSLNLGAFGINSNACYPRNSGNDCAARWVTDSFNANQYSELTITNVGASNIALGPAVRLSTSGAATYYAAYMFNNGRRHIYHNR
jgi:hypothetical protein